MIFVSTYRNFHAHTGDRNLFDLLKEIRNGLFKNGIEKIRELKKSGEKEKCDEEKKRLPAFTTSGTFKDRRKEEFIDNYNGCIVLDIDNISSDQVDELKRNPLNQNLP